VTDTQRSPNRDRLLRTARLLQPLLGELVFVGGQVAELLVTDPAAVRVRPTDDVDVVVPVTTRTAYHALQLRLMALGFTPDHREDAPVCRMRTADDLILDVMPFDEAILGFSNRWYPYAFASATTLTLEPGLDVRIASAAAFLAMKWEAFESRGAANPMSSHDLEDLIAVVAGRTGIVEDVHAAPEEIRHFIRTQTAAFLAAEWAPAILEGNLPDARRVPGLVDAVVRRFQQLKAAD
jgi:predicted nucleotidyltransferase